MIKISPFAKQKIHELYTQKQLSAREIVETLGITISIRQIQRILKQDGLIRTPGDAFRLAVTQGKVTYYHKPEHLKAKRKTFSMKQRYRIFTRDHFTCQACGMTPKEGIRIEIDHKNEDATDNRDENLQAFCNLCNTGKSRQDIAGDLN